MNDLEMGKHEVVWSAMTCEQHQDVMDAIFTKWKVLMAENPSELNDKTVGNTTEVTTNDDTTHMDNSSIIQSVIIQLQHRSYVGVAGGSKPEQNKSKANLRWLSSENLCERANFYIHTRFANTLYGYFIGKRIAFPVVEYYIRNN
ncbi:hypothetical protein Tco_0687796 [Tanacetum coccineum]